MPNHAAGALRAAPSPANAGAASPPSPSTAGTDGAAFPPVVCPALPAVPTENVSSMDAALAFLEYTAGGPYTSSRAGVYTRFAPPLAIVYDALTGCAWLCSVSVDGRLATVVATATWEAR